MSIITKRSFSQYLLDSDVMFIVSLPVSAHKHVYSLFNIFCTTIMNFYIILLDQHVCMLEFSVFHLNVILQNVTYIF